MAIQSMENAFSLKGKNAIVTGGNKGIGFGIATAFAQQGANVAIMCRGEQSGLEAVEKLSTLYPGKFKFYKTDVSDTANCKASCAAAIADFGQIDILVNNSGMCPVGGVLDMDEELTPWFSCQEVDLNGAVRMSYFIGNHMRSTGNGGKIINISSNSADIVNKPQLMAPYNVAKAGLNRFTKCMAYEWAPYKINVNAIAPGYTYSTLTKGIPDDELKEVMAKIPIGRLGEPIEIGALAVFLASEASDMVTGAVYTIDGGYSLAV